MKSIGETKKPRQGWCRGFTMIELLVTMGIFVMLVGVVLANYRAFSTNAEFANASEDIVLALRQAQVYGAGTKGASSTLCPPVTGTSFNCAYGVHFEPGAIPNGFVFFVDINGNGIYDGGELVETTIWNNAISVTGIDCTLVSTPCTGGVMDVTFKRPNPDAHIFDLFAPPVGFPGYKNGWITISDANSGKTSTVAITLAGQISVQ